MVYDIAIIGAGPGGYIAAIRASQLGAKVALIEKDQIGGVCLNRGCIPSKAIIASVDKYNEAKKLSKFGISIDKLSYNYHEIFNRKEKTVQKLIKGLSQLIKANKIKLIKGEACIESPNSLKINTVSEEENIEFKNLIIATGSRPASLPGIELDHEFVLDTDDVLKLERLPESALIVGSGAVGIEWARIFNGLEKDTSLIEIESTLAPGLDESISESLCKEFKKRKIRYYTDTKIEKIENKRVFLSNKEEITPEIVFLGAGRVPNSEIKGIENLNLEKNRGYISVDNNLKTSADNIYAIGDVNGILQLAHVASHQGIQAVEHIITGKEADIDYQNAPFVIYGNPEIASVGCNEKALVSCGIPYKKSVFPMSALGRAMTEETTEGFIKILANHERILGVHIVSERASELAQQLAIAKSAGASPEKLKEIIFAHPTYSEAVHEGILGILEQGIHLPPPLKTKV